MTNNLFKKNYKAYLDKNYSVIPDMNKKPMIKDWKEYCDRLPTTEECEQWSETFQESNIAICMGQASGIVCLDLDTDRPEILNVIGHLLPESPVEKRGSKGWGRYFRYCGDVYEKLSWNGENILEILGEGRKTTIPPSKHVNGSNYVWTTEKTLLTIDKASLPVLPPSLVASLEMKLKLTFGDASSKDYGHVVTGRNSALSSEVGRLLSMPHSDTEVVLKLIEFDKTNNNPPYFTDPNEHQHTEPYTNALLFYAQHRNSYNSKRHRSNQEYLTSIVTESEVVSVKKEMPQVLTKSVKAHDFILADTAVKTIFDNIQANSWVKQPELALGAILALGATLCSRKFMFQGMTTNMYIVNVAPSSAGKNMGMEFAKRTLIDIGAERLLGAGDMASDAGITDTLGLRPVQLYPMDEIGGILKTITSGKSEYNSKMADILAELYTCSTSRYLGRVLAEGVKGAVDRPHLSILGATTPTGFRQGVSRAALEKGLLGRFLMFFGDKDVPSTRVKRVEPLPTNIINHLSWLASYNPEESAGMIAGRSQYVTELVATPEADLLLEDIFYKLDKVRLANQSDVIAPIAGRLYQQMIKLVIIHAGLNAYRAIPQIGVQDVEFGYNVIMAFFENLKVQIGSLIHDSPLEKSKSDIMTLIRMEGGTLDKPRLIKRTPSLSSRDRDSILTELTESGQIEQIRVQSGNRWIFHYQIGEL